MITVRNEFEAIPAFTHIAGCSLGTWSDYETTEAMVKAAVSVSSHGAVLNLKAEFDALPDNDMDAQDAMYEMQQEAAEYIADHVDDYCTVELRDGEWLVIPYIDDELPSFNDYQDDYRGQYILVINDHGNTTLQRWRFDKSEYETVWSVV